MFPFLAEDLLPYGPSNGDTKLDKVDDGNLDDGYKNVALTHKLKFFNEEYEDIYVSTNGGLSFKKGVKDVSLKGFPLDPLTPILAAFYTDINIRNDNVNSGDIWYREDTKHSTLATVTKQIKDTQSN